MLLFMRRMGIDFGTKKIGIALTDESGVMAFPKEVIPNDEKLISYIESFINVNQVKEVVVGFSLGNAGEPNVVHQSVEEFITDITLATGVPVHLEPEQYSTQQAMRIQGRNKNTDASAAAIILDSYITKHKP